MHILLCPRLCIFADTIRVHYAEAKVLIVCLNTIN